MDSIPSNDTTPPFITLDAFDGEKGAAVLMALESARNGEPDVWAALVSEDDTIDARLRSQGVTNPGDRSSIKWDDATVLFTVCMELNGNDRPLQLGDGKARERIGRFPWGSGSPIDYLIEFIRPAKVEGAIERMGSEEIISYLNDLSMRCSEKRLSHSNYQQGTGGLDIRGFLDARQVHMLRKGLSGRGWSVAGDEPLDGGMRDASKHLLTILKAAERRGVGICLRSHS